MAIKAKGKGKGGDEDDGESPFMPLEEVLRKLKSGSMNFGMYFTGDKDSPVLIAAHKRKNAEFLGKQAKKQAGTSKGAFGKVTLESGELRFECENDKVPGSMTKKLKVLLKNEGFMKFKPRILLPGGAELGESDDDEADDIIAPGGSATKTRRGKSRKDDAGGDPLKELVEEMAADIVPRLQAVADGPDEKAGDQATKLLGLLRKAIEAEDWKKAQGILRVADKLERAGGVETAESRADAAEDDPDTQDEEAAAVEVLDRLRDEMGDLGDNLGDLRAAVTALGDDLDEALKEADAMLDAEAKGAPDDVRQREDLRRRATEMKQRLDALGKALDGVEGRVKGVGGAVKSFQKRFARLDEKLARIAALREAVNTAEKVEGEVDDAIDALEDQG
ncbi:MAG: hypothetical protein KF887_09790 [Paracoccaceae bacterium]|nr:MAG: hypothetical protein KF887_09790 [Paracoccaceae bacterium]